MQPIDKIKNAVARWLGIPALVETVEAAAKKAADQAFAVLQTNCANRFQQTTIAFAANIKDFEATVQSLKSEIGVALEAVEARNTAEISKLRETHDDAVKNFKEEISAARLDCQSAICGISSDYQTADQTLQTKLESAVSIVKTNMLNIAEVRKSLESFMARLYQAAKMPSPACVCFYCGFLSTDYQIRGKDAVCQKCAVAGR